jgi:hypothetical protein
MRSATLNDYSLAIEVTLLVDKVCGKLGELVPQ